MIKIDKDKKVVQRAYSNRSFLDSTGKSKPFDFACRLAYIIDNIGWNMPNNYNDKRIRLKHYF